MSTSKNIDKICVVVIILALIVTILFMNGNALGIETVVDEDAEYNSGTTYFTANDQDGSWSTDDACVITLSGTGASISGSGAYYNDGSITIKNAGKYVISGTLDDGSIIVDAYDSSKVWIMLDGVTINCEDDACVIVDQADKVFLTLAEGSVNSLTSGSDYSSDALSDNTGGVIFAHDDLTINGSGTLSINGSYKHGIDANDSLVITGGTIEITCPGDGIHANDAVNIMEADVTITAGDDAIHSDASFYMASGSVLIKECYEGIEALTIDVDGGDLTIYSTDDGMNANGGSSETFGGGMGGMMGDRGGMGDMMSGSDSTSDMTDGTEMSDASRTDIQADMQMPENANPITEDSAIDSEDSAVNDTAGESMGETDQEQESYIRINGGNVTIVNTTGRDADGLDSNGSIYINGGTVLINMLGSSGNCALDYGTESGGSLEVNGGILVACGDSSMAEEFSDSCTQCAVMYGLSETLAAGTELTVTDSAGSVILSYTPVTTYNSVAFSCPEMVVGGTYTFTAGDTSEEFTLSATATSLGSTSGMGGMMGGHGGMGGMMGGMMNDQSTAGGTLDGTDSSASGTDSTEENSTSENVQGQWTGHRGGGGRMGFGKPGENSGEAGTDGAADSTPPQMMPGEGSTDGSAPQMMPGEGSTDGSAPQMMPGEGSTDGSTGNATAQMDGNTGKRDGHYGDNTLGGSDASSSSQDSAGAAANTKTDIRDLSSNVWIMLAASAAVLAAGITAAIVFRKK